MSENTVEYSHTTPPSRIACPDGRCIGIINENGICTKCNRSTEEAAKESYQDTPNYKIPKIEKYIKHLKISFWGIIASLGVGIIRYNFFPASDTMGVINLLLLCSFVLAFYIQVGRGVSFLEKSVIIWLFLTFVFSIFGIIYTYVKLTNMLRDEKFRP